MLESFNKEAGTITSAVNEYYPQKPNVEKIVYQLFGNEDTMYLALQQGDIDMVWALLRRCGRNLSGCTLHRYQCPLVNGCGQCACGPGL